MTFRSDDCGEAVAVCLVGARVAKNVISPCDLAILEMRDARSFPCRCLKPGRVVVREELGSS
jgi:hypothetical protein